MVLNVEVSESVVNELVNLRQDWEQAAEGKPLSEVYGSVGLLLADFVNILELSPGAKVLILGEELFKEVAELL